MDACGVDRPHAVVLGPGSMFGTACVLELLDRGYEVHLPAALLPPPDLWPRNGHRMHVSHADASGVAGSRSALAELTGTELRVAATVLTGDDGDAVLAAMALAGMERGAGGHLLVRRPTRATPSRSSVTVLSSGLSSGWARWLPARLVGRVLRRPESDAIDAAAVARRAVAALVAGRPRASAGVRWRSGPRRVANCL